MSNKRREKIVFFLTLQLNLLSHNSSCPHNYKARAYLLTCSYISENNQINYTYWRGVEGRKTNLFTAVVIDYIIKN